MSGTFIYAVAVIVAVLGVLWGAWEWTRRIK